MSKLLEDETSESLDDFMIPILKSVLRAEYKVEKYLYPFIHS